MRVKELENYGTNVTIYDPWANPDEVMKEYSLTTINCHPERACHPRGVVEGQPSTMYDGIVLTVAHKEFLDLNFETLLKENGVVYDVKGVVKKEYISSL